MKYGVFVLLYMSLLVVSGCVSYGSLMPPLLQAAQKGDLEAVKKLQAGGASIHQRGVLNATVLHYAAASGNLDLVKYLVESGIDANAKDVNDTTPMHLAAFSGYLAIVQYLGDRGVGFEGRAVVTQTPWGTKLNCASSESSQARACTGHGWTPAHYAVFGSLRGELNQKAAKDILGDQFKESMNIYGHVAVLDFLFSQGADINSRDGFGRTLLFYPVILGAPDLLKYLVVEGADVNIRDNFGMSALDWLDRPTDEIVNERHLQTSLLAKHGGKDMDMDGVREIVNQYASVASGYGESGVARSVHEPGFMENVRGTAVECAKLFAGVKACEQLPFPFSTGCEKVVRAKFNKMICQAIPM
ncbi:MAG: ankyrin repeat domain-containing protein [Alcanivoracaceae bacterium]